MNRTFLSLPKLSAQILASLLLLVSGPSIASAVDPSYSGAVITEAQSATDTTVHWVAVPGGSVNGACNGAICILHAEKELFAVALTAHANNRDVFLYYNASDTSKTIPYGSNFSSTCRMKAINLD
jgi:hypothetical protein